MSPPLLWPYFCVPLPLLTSPASLTSLIFYEYTRPAVPNIFSQRARWLASLLIFSSFYKWHLLHKVFPDQPICHRQKNPNYLPLFSTNPFPCFWEKRKRMEWERGKGTSSHNDSTCIVLKYLHIHSIRIVSWEKEFCLFCSLLCLEQLKQNLAHDQKRSKDKHVKHGKNN